MPRLPLGAAVAAAFALDLLWPILLLLGLESVRIHPGDTWRVALLLGSLVLSHWILDAITHRPDMPLWPEGPVMGLACGTQFPPRS